jgi:hypothetical protein
MRRTNSTARCIGLAGLASGLFFARVAVAGIETNTYQLTDTQSVILLERAGQYDEAEARCVQILQKNPNDPDARRLLEEIEDAKHKPHSSSTLSEALEEIIIPEVNFRGAGAADVIEYLRVESQKVSGADSPINFVWEAPENFKTAKVTLNLRSVSLADVLKYVTDSAGLRYRVDPHAVVVYLPPPATPTEFSPSNAKSP